MDGTIPYNNLSITGSTTIPYQLTANWAQPQDQPLIVMSKCKCPNPKHTNGCSIEPESEYCQWCAKGCAKRVQAVHIRYE